MSRHDKATIIQSNILPAALYGIEVTSGCKSLMGSLQAAITDAVGPKSVRRAQAGVFEIHSMKGDLDPQVAQLSRRITTLRRQISKYPALEMQVRLIITRYKTKQGCTEEFKACGPIGFLLRPLPHGRFYCTSINFFKTLICRPPLPCCSCPCSLSYALHLFL